MFPGGCAGVVFVISVFDGAVFTCDVFAGVVFVGDVFAGAVDGVCEIFDLPVRAE